MLSRVSFEVTVPVVFGWYYCCLLSLFCFNKTSKQRRGILVFPLHINIKHSFLEKIDVFSTNEETGDVSEALKTLSYYQETAKGGRKKRQAVELDGDMSPVISNLHASQHCQGVFLRWERPQVPLR